MKTMCKIIFSCAVLAMPLAGTAQQELTEEQQCVYRVLKDFDQRMDLAFSLSDGYLEEQSLSATPASRQLTRKADGERIIRVIHIGEGELLSDLLDVPVETVDSFKLTGFVHQNDLALIRGNIYPKGHAKYDPSLPYCTDYYLTGIDLSDCVIEGDSIPSYTFSGKPLLASVDLPEGLEEICKCAFSGTKSLTSITLPSTLKRLGTIAFSQSAIESVSLPESVDEIGEMCFERSNLKHVTMAKAPLVCGNNVFFKTPLETVELPDGLTKIYDGMFQMSALKTIDIPESVTDIGDGAFNYCILLKTELPRNIVHIGYQAFAYNASEKEFVIPDGVEDIDSLAFYFCGLRCVTIGEGVKSIGLGCFSENKLEYVYCKAMQPPFISEAVEGSRHLCLPFDNSPSRTRRNDVLLVPQGTKELYENAFCWKDFSEIIEVDGDVQAYELMAETTGIQSAPYEKDERLSVYSINGVHIQASSMSELPAGVYIVNGKKVVVR